MRGGAENGWIYIALFSHSRRHATVSKAKTEARAKSYGQAFLNKADTTPEEWIADDKGMPGN